MSTLSKSFALKGKRKEALEGDQGGQRNAAGSEGSAVINLIPAEDEAPIGRECG